MTPNGPPTSCGTSPSDAEALLDLYRVIDAAVEIGLPLMQTSPVSPGHQGGPQGG